MLDKKGRERDRPFFLQVWDGNSSYTIDRIGRGTLYVEHLCFSPLRPYSAAKLMAYLPDTANGGGNETGGNDDSLMLFRFASKRSFTTFS
jgi:hypothetical protein